MFPYISLGDDDDGDDDDDDDDDDIVFPKWLSDEKF